MPAGWSGIDIAEMGECFAISEEFCVRDPHGLPQPVARHGKEAKAEPVFEDHKKSE